MYRGEIDILTTVFEGYLIYINHIDKTAYFKNEVKLDYNYIANLSFRNLLKFTSKSINQLMLSNEGVLRVNLEKIDTDKLQFVTDPIIHIYREEIIDSVLVIK
jgi:hypothetical protein